MITDRGRQFTATAFRRAVRRLGIRQRFGAVGRVGSLALLERCWRTLKALAHVRTRPPLTAEGLARRLDAAIAWYATCRPPTPSQGTTGLAAPCPHLSPLSPEATWRHHLRQEPDAGKPLVRICGGGYG